MSRRAPAWVALLLFLGGGLAASAEAPPSPALFLVAAPGVEAAAQRQRVVLIRRHATGNTIGVTVNRPLEDDIRDLFPDSRELLPEERVLYDGGDQGPGELVYLFRTGSLTPRNALHLFGHVYLGRELSTLGAILRHPNSFGDVRVYRGFHFWPGQSLQREILRGDWWMVEADAETLFTTPAEALWDELVLRLQDGNADHDAIAPPPGEALKAL